MSQLEEVSKLLDKYYSALLTPASFSVTASHAVSYQWRKNGSNISGATSATYNIASTTAADAAQYSVVVTGTCSSVTSNAATLTVNSAPSLTTHPTNQTACTGGSATFSVSARGAGLSYQWRKGGVNISGAMSSSYPINPSRRAMLLRMMW